MTFSPLLVDRGSGQAFVDVLLKVYAKCIGGQEATVNQRIGDGLQGFGG
ncbi:hypothetical protein [Micromonospora sp. Llam0]|nr:hypothetical protein [Micromonospora sp. Llam0]